MQCYVREEIYAFFLQFLLLGDNDPISKQIYSVSQFTLYFSYILLKFQNFNFVFISE